MKTHYRNYSVVCLTTGKELKRKSIYQVFIDEFKTNCKKEFGKFNYFCKTI